MGVIGFVWYIGFLFLIKQTVKRSQITRLLHGEFLYETDFIRNGLRFIYSIFGF